MINKKEFHVAVMNMQENPNDSEIQLAYYKQVQHLSEIIAKSYKVQIPLEDAIQDLIEYSIIKKLHTRIRPEQSAFSYYWKSLGNHAWTINKKQRANKVSTYDMWENSLGDDGAGEEIVLNKLDWSLGEFNLEDTRDFINNMETIEVSKGTRGRPKRRGENEKAPHWEYLFKALKRKSTMTESQLIRNLPIDRQKALKNPGKSVEYYMRQIARRDGFNLTVSENGKETIYMVI